MNPKHVRQAAAAVLLAASAIAYAGERVRIVSAWGAVTAHLNDTPTANAFLGLLPIEIPMRDHLRQEKTSRLETSLPDAVRTLHFASGDLGVWGDNAFVIYYVNGSVPSPGIVHIGKLEGSAKIFDRPGAVTVRVERIQ